MTEKDWDKAIAAIDNMSDAEFIKFSMDNDGIERKSYTFQLSPEAVDKVKKLADVTKLKTSRIVELLLGSCPNDWFKFSMMCAVPFLDRISYRQVEELVEDYEDIKDEIERELREGYSPEDVINAVYTVGMQYVDDDRRNKVHSIARQMRGEY